MKVSHCQILHLSVCNSLCHYSPTLVVVAVLFIFFVMIWFCMNGQLLALRCMQTSTSWALLLSLIWGRIMVMENEGGVWSSCFIMFLMVLPFFRIFFDFRAWFSSFLLAVLLNYLLRITSRDRIFWHQFFVTLFQYRYFRSWNHLFVAFTFLITPQYPSFL